LAAKSSMNLYYRAKLPKKSTFNLPLGFLGISSPSLENVTLPSQKVSNMG
jgi:hypothetical protein